jgi:adenylosuccinate synthase
MMKADVLSQFDAIQVCTHYRTGEGMVEDLPFDIDAEKVSPVYESLPGWNVDLTGMRESQDLPAALNDYIVYLEKALEIPITVVSVGPDRSQTILRSKEHAAVAQ